MASSPWNSHEVFLHRIRHTRQQQNQWHIKSAVSCNFRGHCHVKYHVFFLKVLSCLLVTPESIKGTFIYGKNNQPLHLCENFVLSQVHLRLLKEVREKKSSIFLICSLCVWQHFVQSRFNVFAAWEKTFFFKNMPWKLVKEFRERVLFGNQTRFHVNDAPFKTGFLNLNYF